MEFVAQEAPAAAEEGEEQGEKSGEAKESKILQVASLFRPHGLHVHATERLAEREFTEAEVLDLLETGVRTRRGSLQQPDIFCVRKEHMYIILHESVLARFDRGDRNLGHLVTAVKTAHYREELADAGWDTLLDTERYLWLDILVLLMDDSDNASAIAALLKDSQLPAENIQDTLNWCNLGKQLHRADPRMKTLLQWAVILNKPDSCEVLLKQGADPDKANVFGKTPLLYLSDDEDADRRAFVYSNRDGELVHITDRAFDEKLYIPERYCRPGDVPLTPDQVEKAERASERQIAILHLLVQYRCNLGKTHRRFKYSALNNAAFFGFVPLYEELRALWILNGLDVNKKNKKGESPEVCLGIKKLGLKDMEAPCSVRIECKGTMVSHTVLQQYEDLCQGVKSWVAKCKHCDGEVRICTGHSQGKHRDRKPFVFSQYERKRMPAHYVPPKWCKDCREHRNNSEMHDGKGGGGAGRGQQGAGW
jgi:hypothetical protein